MGTVYLIHFAKPLSHQGHVSVRSARNEDMKNKPALDDLKPPVPGQSQMIPLDLWTAYQKRYPLEIHEQKWDAHTHCPVVIASLKEDQK